MKPELVILSFLNSILALPTATDVRNNVTYNGIIRNGLDVFLGIKYGQDTSGEHRFKPPRVFTPNTGSSFDASSYGPACPQQTNSSLAPLGLSLVENVSEDCLNLNLVRPSNTNCSSKLPVLAFIHGGDFFFNSNAEITNAPDGLVLQSVENETPIIHISLNYRLGGLRDQRLAIEWIRDNVEVFGGDPGKITIHGQSSGGLAVGMQVLAYGGSIPAPFQRAIAESQALENGITGNYTSVQMNLLANATGCNTSDVDSTATIECLRRLDTATLLQASLDTWSEDLFANGGDSWLPTVDGDFLPAAPSELLKMGHFSNVTFMSLWCEDDMQIYTDFSIQSADDVFDFISAAYPGLTRETLDDLLALYPSAEFQHSLDSNLTGEFYRAARIYRDVLMTCMPYGFGQALGASGNEVYFIQQNASILPPILAPLGSPGLGPVHTSEFAYTFGNLSHYNVSDYPFNPTEEDYRLEKEEAGSWAAFASVGRPSLRNKATLQGVQPAYIRPNNTAIFVAGGQYEGLSFVDGPDATPALAAQKLRSRCSFINSPSVITQLQY